MKKITLLLIAAFVCSMVYGQIKVDNIGKVTVGDYWGAGTRLESRGPVVFTQWGAGWENININLNWLMILMN